MSFLDLSIALLGSYLVVGLLVAAWRRETESLGGVAAWVALFGLWVIGACRRWCPGSWPTAVAAAGVWGLLCVSLTGLGAWLGRRHPVRGWVWLLGPVHAMGLAGIWFVSAWRGHASRSRRSAAETGAAPEGREQTAGEALESVVALGETTVDGVMVPRSEMAALPETATVADWIHLARAARHSYLPVFRGELDDIRGYVALHDLLLATDPEASIARFVREARFVPETMRCDDLLRELISHGGRFAIVVDEFGGTAGLVRDQDLFEILLGQIDAEQSEADLIETVRGVFVAQAQYRIADFNQAVPRPLPEGDYETLGGLALSRLGRIPIEGESFDVDGMRWEVLSGTPRRILKLRITLPAESRHGQAAAAAARGAPSDAASDAAGPGARAEGKGEGPGGGRARGHRSG